MTRRQTPHVEAHYDADPTRPEEIESYLHCAQCLDEWHETFRGILSPREYARTQVGIQANGNIQVVCTRHNCNVAVISFQIAT